MSGGATDGLSGSDPAACSSDTMRVHYLNMYTLSLVVGPPQKKSSVCLSSFWSFVGPSEEVRQVRILSACLCVSCPHGPPSGSTFTTNLSSAF